MSSFPKFRSILLFLCILLVSGAFACSSSTSIKNPDASTSLTSSPTEEVIATPEPAASAEPTAVPTPTPTVEPTAEPTPTPEPTLTPEPQVIIDQTFQIVDPEKQVGLTINVPGYKALEAPINLELRLEDGTVIGSGSVSKKSDKLLFTLPSGSAARTTVYLWQEGIDYAIGEKDICVTDPDYQPVTGNYERDDMMIAITFDCAYGERNTDYILDTLKKYNSIENFFSIGTWVGNHYSPWMERMLAEGHEIGNHTETHRRLTETNYNNIYKQINGVSERLADKLGYTSHLFRPPYGSRNKYTDAVARYLGYEVVMWGLSACDSSETVKASFVMRQLLTKVKPGDIILCHNGALTIPQYLDPVLEELTARGYTFGTVSELMGWEWDDAN